RLRAEAALLDTLHARDVEGVARPLALEENGGAPVLVLEDAGPRNLRGWLQHTPLSVPVFLDMATELANVLAAVPRQNVVPPDINPGNVVVGVDRRLTLIDFGLAIRGVGSARRGATGPIEVAGTLAYIAPEQTGRVDRPVDHRADLYSLGATFYEML